MRETLVFTIQELSFVQQARITYSTEQPSNLHRPAAADGFRRSINRSSGAEEQCRGVSQSRQGLQCADYHNYGRDAQLFRPHLPGAAGGLPGEEIAGTQLDELLG